MALMLLATPVYADDFLVGDVHILQAVNNGGLTTVTPEYAWKKGTCGGFGFVDLYVTNTSKDFFTNHVVDCSLSKYAFASTEVGATNGGFTVKAGAGIQLSVPGMKFVRATWYPAVTHDAGDRAQVKFAWLSENVRLTDNIDIYTSGFVRIRHNAPNVAQPQVWMNVKSLPFEVGTEVGIFGDTTTVQVAIKYKF
ncbi:hypothetical protein KTR10_00560 [Candidatus Kaiserbacteria bacterium]|nr:hypothetical protein [Candidatus Kaiserbacteria bacterium]